MEICWQYEMANDGIHVDLTIDYWLNPLVID